MTFFQSIKHPFTHTVTPHHMPDLGRTFLARFWRHLTSTRVACDVCLNEWLRNVNHNVGNTTKMDTDKNNLVGVRVL